MVSSFWHIKSISDACLKINTPDVLFHKWNKGRSQWKNLAVFLNNSCSRVDISIHGNGRNFRGSHVHKHTNTLLHTSTVLRLRNWKCDVTWTMTGVFVKDVAVTSNQWTGASSQRDFPLLGVWLVTLRFSAGWRTVSCQNGIQAALLGWHRIRKKKKNQKIFIFALISSACSFLRPLYTDSCSEKENHYLGVYPSEDR